MERSDADFYHIFMPHDTDGKNRYKAENNGKFHLFSSGWKNGENHLFPSRWKFGPYGQQNGGIVVIPPPRSLRRAYAVSCRETKNPNPLPTANRFGFLDFVLGRHLWISLALFLSLLVRLTRLHQTLRNMKRITRDAPIFILLIWVVRIYSKQVSERH